MTIVSYTPDATAAVLAAYTFNDPPAAVHHGQATRLHAARQSVLDAAYAARPERFVRQPPRPPALPTAVWINKPTTQEIAH